MVDCVEKVPSSDETNLPRAAGALGVSGRGGTLRLERIHPGTWIAFVCDDANCGPDGEVNSAQCVEGLCVDFGAQYWYTRCARAYRKCLILFGFCDRGGNPSLSAIQLNFTR